MGKIKCKPWAHKPVVFYVEVDSKKKKAWNVYGCEKCSMILHKQRAKD